jgi:replicative DNA helicase
MEYDSDIFHFAENRTIFDSLREIYESGGPIDSSVLSVNLRDKGEWQKLQGHLLSVYQTYTPIDVSKHIERLEELSLKRKLELISKDLYNSVKNNDVRSDEFLQRLVEIAEYRNRPAQSEYVTIEQLSNTSLDVLFKSTNFVRTGLRGLDEKIIGLFNGQLVIIAGRPKMGKTTLALNIMQNIKDTVLFFSMEMKATEIYAKILSNISNVTSWKIELNKTQGGEYDKVASSHLRAKDHCKIIIFDGAFNCSKLKASIKKFHKSESPKAVFIDYLQLVTGGQGENQNLRISSITRDLKLLAMELNIPIVLLSQLSRESEKQARRPVISDLRDSGSIEQDADIIIFAHEHEGNTEIIVGANRKGKAGIIKGIKFEKEFSRFIDTNESQSFENLDYIHN